jgi:hypothetical protein
VNASPFLGVLSIAVLSVLGLGLFMSPGLIRLLPDRHRLTIEISLQVLYVVGWTWVGYGVLVRGRHLDPWGPWVWVALMVAMTILAVRDIAKKLAPSGFNSGQGAAK